jgi:hypothetical protein
MGDRPYGIGATREKVDVEVLEPAGHEGRRYKSKRTRTKNQRVMKGGIACLHRQRHRRLTS